MLDSMAKYWWVPFVRGIFAILFGLLAFIWPGLTLLALVLLFGAYALLDGFFNLIGGLSSRQGQPHRWLTLAEGVVSILAGILTFFWPAITALVLLYVIAFWSIVTGVLEISGAIQLRRVIRNEWFLVLGGIASILFGLLLVILPGEGFLALVWLIGGYAIVFGILLISLGLRLRGHSGPRVPGGRSGIVTG